MVLCLLAAPSLFAAAPHITSFTGAGTLAVTNASTNGVMTLERAASVAGPWVPEQNKFTTNYQVSFDAAPTGGMAFFRTVKVDLPPNQTGFSNLVASYGLLTTVAGAGGSTADINKWSPSFEGGPAVNALLSRPHIAVADAAGNIFIADKDAHAVRKVKLDGTIVTVAGTNGPGNAPDFSMPGTQAGLNEPNGLWVKADGTVFILDLSNGKIRRLGTNGMIKTFFAVPGGISAGRGLWVNEDETLAYVASGTVLKRWTLAGGVTDFVSGFVELGNLVVDPWGSLVVTDRRAHLVYRIDYQGVATIIAGTGGTVGGGDGQLATMTALNEVRAVWFLPTGGYFLGTHRGSQLWYVDTAGYIHLFINGSTSDTHSGDGQYFYDPFQFKISEIRAVTVDDQGNVLITEHDSGYIRKVQFLRHLP